MNGNPAPTQLTERFGELLTRLKNPTVSTVAHTLDISETEVYGLIYLMNTTLPYSLEVIDSRITKMLPPPSHSSSPSLSLTPPNPEHVRLLLLSDTHLASKYDRLDILRYLYSKAIDTHTDYALHAGDLTEGVSGRPEQIYELREASYTGQRDYVVENYPAPPASPPSTPPLTTYFIAGNHDLWWIKKCGSDICRDISSRRPDLHYLGSDCEDITLRSLRIRLYHGKGGGAYARSYKLQKYLDAIPAQELPHILMTGHIHTSFYMQQGDTHCFQTACLEDLTPYARSQGFRSDKSVWWLDVYFDSKGRPVQIIQELETFGDKLYRTATTKSKKKELKCR